LIHQWKPWKNSTGAKTTEGKAKVSHNAFKGGLRSQLTELAKALREQKTFISNI
jgi:hypothetical protein